MTSLDRPAGAPAEPDRAWREDPRWGLVERVAGSPGFQRSWRLRALLLFLCERAVRDPQAAIREEEIGASVFGRGDDFDTSLDTLVRVQVSQLRKKLGQHFAEEAAAEPVVIELPRGTYRPEFRERARDRPADAVIEPAEPEVHPLVKAGTARRTMVMVGLVLALALAATSVYLWLDNRALRRQIAAGPAPRPTVDRLWRQMFGGGREATVVLADSNLTLLHDLLHRQLTLIEYQRLRDPLMLAELERTDRVLGPYVRRLQSRQFTTIADAGLARQVGLLNSLHGVPTRLILARDADPQDFESKHVLLSGPRRANPWLDLFEDSLNFRSGFDEEKHVSYFQNTRPQPGEEGRYTVEWNSVGYCRVAYLPNLGANGTALLLSGTETMSTEGCADFVTSERAVSELAGALGVAPDAAFPYFELLLRTKLVVGGAPRFEVIAHRTLVP